MIELILLAALGLPMTAQGQGVPGNFSGLLSARAPTTTPREEDPPPVSYQIVLGPGSLGSYSGDYTRSYPFGGATLTSATAFRVEAFGGPRPLVSVELSATQGGPSDEQIGGDQAAGTVELSYEIGLEQITPPPIPFQNFVTPPLEFFVDAAAEVHYAGSSN